MNIKTLFLLISILGAALPLSQFLPWVIEHGLDVPLFIGQLFANPISSFFGLDVLVSAVVVLLLALTEGRKKGVPHLWAVVLGTCLVGVSFGLPFYLYLRESKASVQTTWADSTSP